MNIEPCVLVWKRIWAEGFTHVPYTISIDGSCITALSKRRGISINRATLEDATDQLIEWLYEGKW